MNYEGTQINLSITGDTDELFTVPNQREKPKLLILGHAQHGKDTVAELLRDRHNYKLTSSSELMAKRIVEEGLLGGRYSTWQDCFEDRVNFRDEWFDLFVNYNTPDLTAWSRKVMETSDMYVGMRNRDELIACVVKGVFNWIIWVDRSEHVAPESYTSFTISQDQHMADFIINNNHEYEDLVRTVDQTAGFLDAHSSGRLREPK